MRLARIEPVADTSPGMELTMKRVLALLFAVAALPAQAAEQPCGLCAHKVTINSELAACFLGKFPQLESRKAEAVVVDLTDCPKAEEADRGIIPALPQPGAAADVPDTEYILTMTQLVCLKAKLEAPELKLDPSATISLDACQ